MAVELDPLAGADGTDPDKSHDLAKHWQDQITSVKDNSEYKRWVKRGEMIEKRYRDERARVDEDQRRRYNALWSNVEILKPAFYGRMPQPVVERRFNDKDPVARGAAQLLERGLRNEVEICGFDEAMQQAVGDYLLPGRGTVWVRYEPEIEEGVSLPVEANADINVGDDDRDKGDADPDDKDESPEEQEEIEKLEQTGDRVIRESTPVDFIQWPDFFVFPVKARVWSEVIAIGKRVHMSRKQMVKRFGKKIGKAIPLKRDERGQANPSSTLKTTDEDKGEIFEIWSRQDKTVYWVSEGYDHLLDRKADPLNLEYFFPCPKPLFANPTNNTLIPVADYIQYQDQAIQIDQLTQRIAMLTKACKVAGVYNSAAKDIQRLFTEGVENQLIPVDQWAAFAEKGGVEGNMSLIPVKDIIGVMNELMTCKQHQIEEMDRLTGITDIMRGTTDARETLGGQRLKSNSAGTRLTSRQNEVARFARDTIRIMADIMSQHFSPTSLIEVSGALYQEGLGPDDMPTLTQLEPQPPQAPQQPALPPPPRPGVPPGMPPGAPPGPAMGGPPGPMPAPQAAPMPPGGNVVPLHPPQAPGAPPMGQQMAPGPLNGQILPPPPPIPPEVQEKLKAFQRISAAIQLLRNERLRGFRVDIEVDSTIFPDAAQDKADRTVFVKEITAFLQTAMAMGATMPESIPLLGKLLQFGVRGYRVGRDLESAIEEFTEQSVKMAVKRQAEAANQPNPEVIKGQIEVQKSQSQLETQKIRSQADVMRAQADMAQTQVQAQSDQAQAAAEVERQRIENEGEQQNSQADLASKQLDYEMQQIEKQMDELRLKMEERMSKVKIKIEETKAKAAVKKANAPKSTGG